MTYYPEAVQKPLVGHSQAGKLENKKLVILHITEGTTFDGAFQTFKSSATPYRVSAHFIIDRDGTVYQLLPLEDTAWHARQVNTSSIAIEHVALSANGAIAINKAHGSHMIFSPATFPQYVASAKLVKWLCDTLKIPLDRFHVRTHNEASPVDGHKECCTGGLDPDKVVNMAKELK